MPLCVLNDVNKFIYEGLTIIKIYKSVLKILCFIKIIKSSVILQTSKLKFQYIYDKFKDKRYI